VRSGGQLAWWHYRWGGVHPVERVSLDLGHWSSVVDIAELLASAIVELALDEPASRALVGAYVSCSNDREVWQRLNACVRLYLHEVSARARRPGTWRDDVLADRRAVLHHGGSWLTSSRQ
jgi:hypothetical protein